MEKLVAAVEALLVLAFIVALSGCWLLPRPSVPEAHGLVASISTISAAQQSLLSWAEVISLFGIGAGVFLGVFASGASRLAVAMVAGFGAVFAASTTFKYLDPFMPWIVAGLVVVFFAWLVAHLVHKERNHLTLKQEFEGVTADLAALQGATAPTTPLLAGLLLNRR